MKRFLPFLFCLFAFTPARADEFVVRSFKPAPADLAAIQHEFQDANDEKCAIIKVRTDLRNLVFDSGKNLAKDVEFRSGEYWLYVSPDENRLTVMKEGFIPLHYNIEIPVKASKVYILEITNLEKGGASTGTMRIITEPPGATVTIRELSGLEMNTPALLENYPAFPYTVTIAKDRYATLDTVLALHPDEEILHLLKLLPLFGDLVISVDPIDAEIYIDDKYFGTGYQELVSAESGIDVGEHRVKVVKQGYYPEEQVINILNAKHESLQFELNPILGFLKINVSPPDAKLFLDGKEVGELPFEDSLQVGFYEIFMEQKEYLSVRKTIEVREKEATIFNEVLKHTTLVRITSDPMQADVYLSGNFMGKTPENILLTYGTNYLTLKKENFEVLNISLEVTGTTKRFDLKLDPQKYDVKIGSAPSGANVYVDQILVKETPAEIKLPFGEYRLMVEKNGYFRKRKLVKVGFDNQSFNFRLQKLRHLRVGFIRGADSWGGELTYIENLVGLTGGYFQPPMLKFGQTIDHQNINTYDYYNLEPANSVGKESNPDSLSFKFVGKLHLFLRKAPTFSFVMGLALGKVHYSNVYLADQNYEGIYSGEYIGSGEYYSVAREGNFKVSPLLGVSLRVFRYLYANAEYWFFTEKGTAFFFGGGICYPLY